MLRTNALTGTVLLSATVRKHNTMSRVLASHNARATPGSSKKRRQSEITEPSVAASKKVRVML